MQVFKPFRSTFHRQQKYYSEKRVQQNTPSVLNLPKNIFNRFSTINLNSNYINLQKQKTKSTPRHNQTYSHSNQQRFNKKNNKPPQALNKKQLQKATLSIILTNKNQKPSQKIVKNRSVDRVNNKNLSFQALNILYRTIFQTKQKKKSKLKFQIKARKLPIMQKQTSENENSLQLHKNVEVLVRKTPFSDEKRKPLSKNKIDRIDLIGKKGLMRNRENNFSNLSLYEEQNQNVHIFSHLKRFKRRPSTSLGMNQIVPWNQNYDASQNEHSYPAGLQMN